MITAWFTFETAVGRGTGLVRLVEEDGAPGLDVPDHAVRAQGPRGAQRRTAADGRRARRRQATGGPGRSSAQAEAETPRARRPQPYVLVDRRRPGRHRARRPAAPARRAEPGRSTSTRGPATSGATATSRCACTTRSGTTTCPTCKFPENWPVFAPKDKIADWLESYAKVMEVPYWSSTEAKSRDVRPRRPESGPSSVEREGEPLTLRPKQLVLATGMSGKPNVPDAARPGRLPRRPAPLVGAPGPGRVRGQEGAW